MRKVVASYLLVLLTVCTTCLCENGILQSESTPFVIKDFHKMESGCMVEHCCTTVTVISNICSVKILRLSCQKIDGTTGNANHTVSTQVGSVPIPFPEVTLEGLELSEDYNCSVSAETFPPSNITQTATFSLKIVCNNSCSNSNMCITDVSSTPTTNMLPNTTSETMTTNPTTRYTNEGCKAVVTGLGVLVAVTMVSLVLTSGGCVYLLATRNRKESTNSTAHAPSTPATSTNQYTHPPPPTEVVCESSSQDEPEYDVVSSPTLQTTPIAPPTQQCHRTQNNSTKQPAYAVLEAKVEGTDLTAAEYEIPHITSREGDQQFHLQSC